MSYPAILRSQQILPNISCAGNATILTQNQTLWFEIYKGIMATGAGYKDAADGAVASPVATWVLTGSSDGATSGIDATNRLTTTAKFIWATAGNAHTWFVIRNTVLGVYLLFDFVSASTQTMTVKSSTTAFSAAAGGTDGSTTTAPTAASSINVCNNTSWGGSNVVSTATKLNVWISADAKSTRVVMCRNSHTVAHWHFDLPESPITGWTKPAHLEIIATNTAAPSSDIATLSGASGGTGIIATGFANALTAIVIEQASPSVNAGRIADVQTTSDSFAAAFPFIPILLFSRTSGSTGYLGFLADLYFCLTAISTGQGSPGTEVSAPSQNQYMVFGPWYYVWPLSVIPSIV